MTSLSDLRHLVRDALHKRAPSNAPPKSIQVVVVRADGSPFPEFRTLHTVKTDITALNTPSTNYHMGKVTDARLCHMVYHDEENGCQPDIKFLPDIKHHGYWDDEAWNHRCVTGTAEFHLFSTRSKEGLRPNSHVADSKSGDMFILKVSDTDTKDRYGKNFYVDIESGDLWPGIETDLLWGNWTQAWSGVE